MCLLAAGRRSGALWIAANRDELLQRPFDPPQLLLATPPVFGGRDRVSGGSWLAVNLEAAFVAGVTNAHRGAAPGERSRGSLVLELAAEAGLPEAVALLTEIDLQRYGSFNLLLADAATFWIATNHPVPRILQVSRDVVVLGNDPLDHPSGRVGAARGRVEQALAGEGEPRAGLAAILADHEGDDPVCRHGETYGTVCSTILVLGRGGRSGYWYSAGPPCKAKWRELDLPVSPPH